MGELWFLNCLVCVDLCECFRHIAVITLKFEEIGPSIEKCPRKMYMERDGLDLGLDNCAC